MPTDTCTTVIDVIEAFADGEPVDPASLGSALANPAGRDHLIDVLALRALVAGDAVVRPAVLPTTTTAKPPRGAWGRWIPLAAGIAIIGGITGYVAGSHASSPPMAAEPTVTSPAPPPTQVIQLRNGVDWTEHAGGN